MSGEAEVKKLIECPLEYSMCDDTGTIASGSAAGRIDEENVSIIPKTGEPILFSPREVLEFVEGDYVINLLLTSKEKLVLSKLGINFENFSRILSKARNEVVIKDMLMYESMLVDGFKGSYESNGRSGNCELRLYDSGLVVIVERGEPLRVQYSNIARIEEGDYSVTLALESGEKLTLSKMGGQHEPFKKALNDAMNRLNTKAQELIKSFTPGVDSSVLRRAAQLMRDGKAAKKGDLDAISPALWRGLEKKIEEIGVLEEYKFLGSLAQKEKMCVGFKRGLMGDFTGDYVWILAPVPGSNAVILEAVSAGEGEAVEPLQSAVEAEGEAAVAGELKDEAAAGGGRWATYVFSIVPRSQYPAQDMDAKTDAFLKSLNDCMLSINFRREPIFTSDDDLELPKNIKYWYSVRKLPLLRELRSHFVGRAIHVTKEQWQKAVKDVLNFNATSREDGVKYKK